jgi:hypothetical protein
MARLYLPLTGALHESRQSVSVNAPSRIDDDVWTAVLAAVIVLNAAGAAVLSDHAMFVVVCTELLAFVVVAGSNFVRTRARRWREACELIDAVVETSGRATVVHSAPRVRRAGTAPAAALRTGAPKRTMVSPRHW